MQWLRDRFYGTEEEEAEEQVASTNIGDTIKELAGKQRSYAYRAKKHRKDAHAANKAGDRGKAARLLKTAKQMDAAALQLGGQITNLEQTHLAIDSTATATDMVSAMKHSVQTMTTQQAALSVEEVQAVRADLEDLTIGSSEISRALSDPFQVSEIDEDDIAAQLAEWDDEEKTREVADLDDVMPVAPSRALTDDNNNNNNGSDRVKI